MANPLLEVKHLHLILHTSKGQFHALKDLSFHIFPGEIVGLVGESGCGKSLTIATLFNFIHVSHTLTGHILFQGEPLKSFHQGTQIGCILQDPTAALNPVLTIESQLIEGLCFHQKLSRRAARLEAIDWLQRVGINDASYRLKQYPHELSGGMKQRLLIAMALMMRPLLLVADEPTTALDPTVQAQILDLLYTLQQEEKISLLLITHDLGVVSHYCQRIYLMSEGQIVESGMSEELLNNPQHHYSQKLLQARRHVEQGFQ